MDLYSFGCWNVLKLETPSIKVKSHSVFGVNGVNEHELPQGKHKHTPGFQGYKAGKFKQEVFFH